MIDILNNEHIEVIPVGEPAIAYRISAKEGWHLCLTDEENEKTYSKAMSLLVERDWTQFEVVPESEVPELESE